MDAKPKRRTRERILETALDLFNNIGEPGVDDGDHRREMNISPGNLYYHYHSKDKIVEALFAQFAGDRATLAAPESRPTHAEDVWLFLHLMFEAICQIPVRLSRHQRTHVALSLARSRSSAHPRPQAAHGRRDPDRAGQGRRR